MFPFRIRYQTLEFGTTDIHVCSLRDNQEFSDENDVAAQLGISSATWPLFGVIWPSGEVLAHLMASYNIEGKQILEVGCGLGLASLLLNERGANITATDYHPVANKFLTKNTQLNNQRSIPFIRTDWGDPIGELGEFDIIIGSDLLYEAEHSKMLSRFINQHAANECEIILIDPNRGNSAKFSRKMVALGYSHHQTALQVNTEGRQNFNGRILRYER